MLRKITSLILSFCLLFTQTGFVQAAAVELNLSNYFARMASGMSVDSFRPVHLRYFSYDSLNNSFKVLLDKGDLNKGLSPKGTDPEARLKAETKELLKYFLIGLTLPNDKFWVNLRPDSPKQIIDFNLEETDIGKIMLEADLQLKKDTAQFTSPQTPEGKEYWNKLYKKAEELYGSENITIPTLTRPWIVPNEVIVRETKDSAYVYKATLKVMLEQDYLKDSATYSFKDSRSKALNEYSSQLIRELIIPKLTKEVNLSKRYAPLRQVYYSLILSRWFKSRFADKKGLSPTSPPTHQWREGTDPDFISLIDKNDLTNLTSKDTRDKSTYFNAYKKSFAEGEYNIQEPVYTPTGQTIRSYFSGGMDFMKIASSGFNSKLTDINAYKRSGLTEMDSRQFDSAALPAGQKNGAKASSAVEEREGILREIEDLCFDNPVLYEFYTGLTDRLGLESLEDASESELHEAISWFENVRQEIEKAADDPELVDYLYNRIGVLKTTETTKKDPNIQNTAEKIINLCWAASKKFSAYETEDEPYFKFYKIGGWLTLGIADDINELLAEYRRFVGIYGDNEQSRLSVFTELKRKVEEVLEVLNNERSEISNLLESPDFDSEKLNRGRDVLEEIIQGFKRLNETLSNITSSPVRQENGAKASSAVGVSGEHSKLDILEAKVNTTIENTLEE